MVKTVFKKWGHAEKSSQEVIKHQNILFLVKEKFLQHSFSNCLKLKLIQSFQRRKDFLFFFFLPYECWKYFTAVNKDCAETGDDHGLSKQCQA